MTDEEREVLRGWLKFASESRRRTLRLVFSERHDNYAEARSALAACHAAAAEVYERKLAELEGKETR
jgi:hypothetical protein